MRRLVLLVLPAAWLLTTAATATPARTPTPLPTPQPTPTPTPSLGQLSLSPTLGSAGVKVTVQGSQFGPNEQVKLYWDSPDKALGTIGADDKGAFRLDVEVPTGDPGQHQICAVETGTTPCASFRLEAATPSPTPSASASATPAATPVATATPVPLPSTTVPATQNVSAVSVLLQPPFVFFPLLLLAAALGGAGLWIWSGLRATPRPARRIAAATVTHRSVRPDAAPVPQPPADAPKPEPPLPQPPANAPEPVIAGPRAAGGDDALDLPQPSD
ncbi:MAG TPA: hypothetical protein VF134_06270 [Candidatus Dormibacteraeota bacterium]